MEPVSGSNWTVAVISIAWCSQGCSPDQTTSRRLRGSERGRVRTPVLCRRFAGKRGSRRGASAFGPGGTRESACRRTGVSSLARVAAGWKAGGWFAEMTRGLAHCLLQSLVLVRHCRLQHGRFHMRAITVEYVFTSALRFVFLRFRGRSLVPFKRFSIETRSARFFNRRIDSSSPTFGISK